MFSSFSRAVGAQGLKPLVLQQGSALPSNAVRGMAGGGQKQLKERIVGVTSVRKITKAMQMIASSKMKAAERRMLHARVFAQDMLTIWPEPNVELDAPQVTLVVPVTSDRGLCGGLNTGVTRPAKRIFDAAIREKKEANFGLFTVGEKARAHLERAYQSMFRLSATDAGKIKPTTFAEVSLITDHLIAQPYDQISFMYQKFVNSLTYSLQTVNVPSLPRALADRDYWFTFDIEGVDVDVLENLYEFRLSVLLYYFMSESGAAEMSARVNSMANSSKNAGELIDRLVLQYNRTRQSQVTTELLEVISGAMAADEGKKKN